MTRMNGAAHIKTLFDYHWHTTGRLIECAARLPPEAYHAHPGYDHGSIHQLLLHLLQVDAAWRVGLQTGRQEAPINAEDYPDLPAVQAGFERERRAWQELLDSYSADQIDGDINMTSRRGDPFTFKRWRLLHHVILHGMQHHAETAALLTASGQSPGNLDFLFYQG